MNIEEDSKLVAAYGVGDSYIRAYNPYHKATLYFTNDNYLRIINSGGMRSNKMRELADVVIEHKVITKSRFTDIVSIVDSCLKEKDNEAELDFLRYFYNNACYSMGPADSASYRMIKDDYMQEHDKEVPKAYRDED